MNRRDVKKRAEQALGVFFILGFVSFTYFFLTYLNIFSESSPAMFVFQVCGVVVWAVVGTFTLILAAMLTRLV